MNDTERLHSAVDKTQSLFLPFMGGFFPLWLHIQ